MLELWLYINISIRTKVLLVKHENYYIFKVHKLFVKLPKVILKHFNCVNYLPATKQQQITRSKINWILQITSTITMAFHQTYLIFSIRSILKPIIYISDCRTYLRVARLNLLDCVMRSYVRNILIIYLL